MLSLNSNIYKWQHIPLVNMRFFERLDLQVKQLYRSIGNLTKPRHLKLARKIAKKQIKEKRLDDIMLSGGFAGFTIPKYSIDFIRATYTLIENKTISILTGMLIPPGSQFIAAQTANAGLGFYRGVRNKEESLDTLEKMIEDNDFSMKDIISISDSLEKSEKKETPVLVNSYIGNKKLMNHYPNVKYLTKIIEEIFENTEIKNLELSKKIIEKENYPASLILNLPKINELDGFSHDLLYELINNNKEFELYGLDDYMKIKDKLNNATELQKVLLKTTQKNKENKLYFLNNILEIELDEKYLEEYKLALEYDNITNLKKYDEILKKLDNTQLYQFIPNTIKRKVSVYDLRLISDRKEKIISNEYAFKMISDLMKVSQRQDFSKSLDITLALMDNSEEILKDLASYGKKKRKSIFSRLSPIFEIFETKEVISLINDYKKEGISIETMLEKDIIKQKIEEYFGGITINQDITNNELLRVLKGYQHNKNKTKYTKKLFESFLSGKSLWEYRQEHRKHAYNSFEKENSEIIDKWKKGYCKLVKNEKFEIKIDNKKICEDNYKEALDHINSTGLEIKYEKDMLSHSQILIEKFKDNPNYLIKDALEHLEVIVNYHGKKDIVTNEIMYGTGTINDFVNIGHFPAQTCLGLNRMNSDCLLSMIGQANTLPFFTYIENRNDKTIIGRSILRLEDQVLIVDDIYGNTEGMVFEIYNFAKELNKEILIPEKQLSKLTKEEQSFVNDKQLVNKYVKGPTKGLYYSDSLGGRINSELGYTPC